MHQVNLQFKDAINTIYDDGKVNDERYVESQYDDLQDNNSLYDELPDKQYVDKTSSNLPLSITAHSHLEKSSAPSQYLTR